MLCVNEAQYLSEYKIHLVFNNSKEGVANLEKTIFEDKRAIFSELKKIASFRRFSVNHSTLTWFNALDLAPEYLFYLVFQEDADFHSKFKKWGYAT